MNECDFQGVKMTKRDYFRLPATMRKMSNGLMVWSCALGKARFLPVILIDL